MEKQQLLKQIRVFLCRISFEKKKVTKQAKEKKNTDSTIRV